MDRRTNRRVIRLIAWGLGSAAAIYFFSVDSEGDVQALLSHLRFTAAWPMAVFSFLVQIYWKFNEIHKGHPLTERERRRLGGLVEQHRRRIRAKWSVLIAAALAYLLLPAIALTLGSPRLVAAIAIFGLFIIAGELVRALDVYADINAVLSKLADRERRAEQRAASLAGLSGSQDRHISA